MARDSTCEASSWWEEAAFRWQRRPQRPDEEPGVSSRDVAVDPLSLRHFSRVDIDRPLPIPSVSVDDRLRRLLHGGASVPAGSASSSSSSSPRAATAGGAGALEAPAAPTTWWEWDGARPIAHSECEALGTRSKLSLSLSLSAAGGETTELADAGLDVTLPSSAVEPERKASEPQRWGSDVPLIAAAADAEKYSFGGYYAATKDDDGRGGKHAGRAPFTCCMFVPGLTRRIVVKPPPTSSSMAAKQPARSSSSAKCGNSNTAAVQPIPIDDAGTCSARPSAVSLAVSLERFDCDALSTSSSSPRGLGLDAGEAAASASSYFDLPLELILGCGEEDDADLPVCAAFLFDSDGIRKSLLKRSLEAGAGWEPRRPSLGKVSMDVAGNPQIRVSLKSRSP